MCVMTVPSLSVPCLTLQPPSHPSSLAPGAKYAMHLVLGFFIPLLAQNALFSLHSDWYIYAMNTKLQPTRQG